MRFIHQKRMKIKKSSLKIMDLALNLSKIGLV